MDADQTKAPALLPSKPPLDRHRSHHDACQGQDSLRWPLNHRHCAPCRRTDNQKPCGTTVNRLSLVYKGRRRPLSRGGGRARIANSFALPPSPTILALCLNQHSGTWRLFLLSYLACSPTLRAPQCQAIQHHERTPAGRTAHSRN
jgi:hypothetical protein